MNRDMMNSLVGKIIKIDRGGPESRTGKLLDVYDDHLVIITEDDGVVYYSTHHIKSVTENAKEQLEFNIEVPEGFEFKKAETFQGLLEALKFQWVKINRGGPEKLEGVLSDVTQNFVSLINKEEIVRLSMFHIRNISYGLKIEKAEEEKSDDKQNNQAKMSEDEKQELRNRVVKTESTSQYAKNKER
jgi:spore coat protein B